MATNNRGASDILFHFACSVELSALRLEAFIAMLYEAMNVGTEDPQQVLHTMARIDSIGFGLGALAAKMKADADLAHAKKKPTAGAITVA